MLRDNLAGLIEPMLSSARAYPLALCTDGNESSDDRPQDALKIPARQGGIYTLAENVASPFHAEPPQFHILEDGVTVAWLLCEAQQHEQHWFSQGQRFHICHDPLCRLRSFVKVLPVFLNT